MPLTPPVSIGARWLTFNAVGAAGFLVQIACVWLLVEGAGLHYVPGAALALEAAILHNFVLHTRWTWRDRRRAGGRLDRLARYHGLHGATAILNLTCTVVLVEAGGLSYLPATVLGVAACSLLNFLVSHTVVFVALCAIAASASSPAAVHAAELTREATLAFERYASIIEDRLDRERTGSLPFLGVDRLPEPRRREAYDALRAGEVVLERIEAREENRRIECPDSLCHHWMATVLVPNVGIAPTMALMQAYDRYSVIHHPAVRRSHLIARDGDRFHVSLQLYAKKVVSVVLNTEQTVEYLPAGAVRAQVRSRSTRIAEVEHVGTAAEREQPVGRGQGFLWRFNNYCAIEARDEGTYIQCETLSLTRDIPTGLGWLVRPFVSSVPRESLEATLTALRRGLVTPPGR
jgi:putative flippase GtrA